MDDRSYGQIGYEAYAASTGGKTYDGRTMPAWSELPPNITKAWEDAASAIARAHVHAVARACDDAEPLPSTKRNA